MEIHRPASILVRGALLKIRDRARAIVVGGGGLIGQQYFENDLSFWGRGHAPLVLWGAGHNSHDPYNVSDSSLNSLDYLQLNRYSAIGIRDYSAGFCWVPCASCMHPELSKQSDTKAGVVVALHRDVRENKEVVAQIFSQSPDATLLYNDSTPEHFIGTLRSARVVVTNSYHACYWASLMGKPVVAVGGGSKIRTLKHEVAISTVASWSTAVADAPIHEHALEECRQRNVDFNVRVREIASQKPPSKYSAPSIKDPIADQLADFKIFNQPLPALIKRRVPKVIHFIFGLLPDFGGKPFNIMHSIAVLSAVEKIKPEQIIFHYSHLPDTAYFELVKSHLTLNKVQVPEYINGRKLTHFAHKADVLRMQLLQKFGGIYLDLDTITVASFDHLLEDSVTLGLQGRYSIQGLCNAVMICAPKDEFITEWLGYYENFSDSDWDGFSVKLPSTMWRSGKWPVNVLPYDRFHWPLWDPAGLKMMFEEDHEFPNALCHHLWESKSFKKYFPEVSLEHAEKFLSRPNTTYKRLARRYF
jgi:hypothetical protein